MNEQKVVEIKSVDKKPKGMKPRIEPVSPIQIVDVWRLMQRSIENQVYPDLTEESPEVIRSHLFAYLQQPLFTGLLARFGKRPIGLIMGHVAMRPFGRPSRYGFIQNFWVEPQYRKSGVGQALWMEYTAKLKKSGIFYWESHIHEPLMKNLVKESGIPVNKMLHVVGGRT